MRTHVSSTGLLIRSDPAGAFVYPRHIARAGIDALPARPGVYVFRDGAGRALYVGKSINLRARVLSHLRTPDEASMLARTTHIEFERTAGEIGALLLESARIKQWQPVFNRKLRRSVEMCSLSLQGALPQVVYGRDCDFAGAAGLYGLFASRRAALDALRDIVSEHELCPVMTGLEAAARGRAYPGGAYPGRPCFARQIGRCRGACCGLESAQQHMARLKDALDALRVCVWPYDGAVGIVEQCDGWRQTLVVDRWCYLGILDSTAPAAARPAPRFDIDTYRILVKPLLLGNLTIELLARPA